MLGDNEEYCSFITPEVYQELWDWIDFGASYGEKVTGEGWVFRDFWQTATIVYLGNLCLAASQDTQEKRSKISYQKSFVGVGSMDSLTRGSNS